MMQEQEATIKARLDFRGALGRGFRRKILLWLGRGCNDLLSFNDVFQYLRQQPHTDLGLQEVPLERIVGSAGRARDFDLLFYPRQAATEARWVAIARLNHQGKTLPPVLLYKVGDAYFVEDGNHRVSVARAGGRKTIRARVIEIDASHLAPEPSCTRLGYKLDSDRPC